MSEARWITADVFDGLATLADGSVDLVMSSPPFLAVRSYLPADHPDKGREIGGEANPAAFIDTLLRVVAECGRVLAPHGSLVFELGDTYAGSGGAGGDYQADGLREGQPAFDGTAKRTRSHNLYAGSNKDGGFNGGGTSLGSSIPLNAGPGWPLAKSKCLIPEAFAVALAYGINPLTGQPSPAGRWRVRNVIAWCRTNPPVGALGDKWRPAHSSLIVATRAVDRYWDDVATRQPHLSDPARFTGNGYSKGNPEGVAGEEHMPGNAAGAPLRDWWVINNTGFDGSHFATYPPELVVPVVAAMCPEKVCIVCGQPSRRITETTNAIGRAVLSTSHRANPIYAHRTADEMNDVAPDVAHKVTVGWTDCGHNTWRRGHVLDPFAGTGTTLAVATGHGRDATGIDLDPRNLEHARTRLGMFLTDEVTA